jgi:hypothetical protein
MQRLIVTWQGGTIEQAREYVASIKRVQAKKERREKMARWFAGNAEVWRNREEFERQYFGEIV